VSAKTWATLTPEDRTLVRRVGEEVMALQKREAREGLEGAAGVLDILQKIYGMEGTQTLAGRSEGVSRSDPPRLHEMGRRHRP
jgi:TRAP-type C4-dicarboxylate transport system substrate-binding protein